MYIQDNREKLEVLDNNGNFVGTTVDRTIAHSEGIMHGACHIHICKLVDGELNVLL